MPGRSLDDVDRVVAVALELTDDDPAAVEAAGRRHADGYAFTFGAMGTATKNFYNDAFARQGYGDDVEEVRRLWAAGDRAAAAARVPIEIGLGTNLIGPPATIKQRLVDYERSGVTTLRINLDGPFDRKIADLEVLLALVADAGDAHDVDAASAVRRTVRRAPARSSQRATSSASAPRGAWSSTARASPTRRAR